MAAIDISQERRLAGAWLARLLRRASRRPQKGPGTSEASRVPDHMKRDIGLIDSTPPLKMR